MRILACLTLLCSTLVTACTSSTTLKWETRPSEVLVAEESAVFRVPGTGTLDSLAVPRDRSLLSRPDARRLEYYRIEKDGLSKVSVSFANGRLTGKFIGGERYLIVLPELIWIHNKHTLLCRLKLVHVDLIRIRPDIMDAICPRILCPADVFLGDRLLDEFGELRGFPDEFPHDELRGMELGPLSPGGAGLNLCDQCFGRDWGMTLIPECRDGGTPGCRRWVANGPGPNTFGQVENIANREVVGAVNAVAPHPTDANTVYVGAVNGGLWRTTNATATAPIWTRLSDTAPSLSIGAVEFDPTDASGQTLLAGTGRFSSLLSRGGARAGLLRTTNGVNWTAIDGGGVLRGLNISGVEQRGATLVIAANAADTLANRGVWRSTDTGATWTQISGAVGGGLPAGATFDLASDPGNAARLFANAGNGIFRSADTGATWARVSNAAMDALLGTAGNVDIAVGNANNVFVAIVAAGTLTGLFRSGEGGGTWTALDLPRTTENAGAVMGIHPGGQGATHLSIAADPTNTNIVYVGGDRQPCFTESAGCNAPGVPRFPNSLGAADFSGRLFRVDASRAAGTQAAALTHSGTAVNSAPHADSRDMDFAADGVLIEVDDGGIYRRTNPRANTGDWFSMNGTLQTTEFHTAAWDSNANIIIGGAQDTGTPEQQTSAGLTWRSVSTADGGDVAVDDTQTAGTSVRYSSFQFLGNFRRSTFDAANVLQSTVFPPLTVVGGGNPLITQFYTPIRLNNVNPSRLIIGGGNSVYESFDQGTTIREIGVGVVVNDTSTDPIAYGATGNADMLYVGSGSRVLIRNAAPPAALTASATYPGTGNVNDIAIDPATPNTAFVVDATSVFRTADGGGTWTNMTGNLATFGVGTIRSVVFRSVGGTAVVVGADTGVFIATGPTFNTWGPLGCELPRVPVYDLEFDAQDRVFVAGTLGRGAWVLDDN